MVTGESNSDEILTELGNSPFLMDPFELLLVCELGWFCCNGIASDRVFSVEGFTDNPTLLCELPIGEAVPLPLALDDPLLVFPVNGRKCMPLSFPNIAR